MSSLTGIAQFTNQFAKNIMGYDQDKKDEAERVADKQYNRNRQAQQDKNAQETHDVNYQTDTLKLEDAKDTRTDAVDKRNYGKTFNKVEYFKSLGDETGAIDAIIEGANSHSDLPYKINVARDANGKVEARTDENGNKYYFQNIIDKDTGKVMRTDSVTYDQLMNGYKQLQNGQALAAEKDAYEAEKRKEIEKDQRELTLYGGKKKIDVKADGIKAERDHGYTVSLKGLDFKNQTQRDETLHGYAIDKQNNQAGHAQSLAYIQGELAAGRIDQQTYNRMEEYLYKAGVDQGQVPNTGSGGSWGSFDALIGPESNGQQLNSRGQPLTSSAGAIGIAQVMPDTAKYVAKKNGIAWDANKYKTDPNYNYNLGKLYYQEQLNKYGHPALAYAAYNAGPGAVDKWIKKNPAMKNPDAMGMQNFINAIPFSETKNYVAKIHRQSSGVQTTLTQPLAAKTPKGASKTNQTPAQTVRTTKDYNATVDKGVNIALKDVKDLGIKPDAATTATYARAGTKLKSMGAAKNEQEFLNLYQEAFDLVIGAVPDRASKKMSKADKNALGHKVLLSMAGASSLGQLKQMIYNINPRARGGGKAVSAGGLTLNLPGQQATSSKPASQFQAVRNRKQQEAADAFNGKSAPIPTGATPQTGKLQSLYARGLPAVKTDPKAQENIDYLSNLNDSIDW